MKDLNELRQKMLAKIGQVADTAKDFAEKTADSAKDFAEKAADKAKDAGRIAKLNVEIATEKENMKKTYIEIGKLYYDTHKDDPDGFFIQLCEEIQIAEKNIAAKEAEIAELKAAKEDDSIEVEFEEVVAEEEAAAAECCDCGCGCVEEAPAEEPAAEDCGCGCDCAEEAPAEDCGCGCDCAEEAPAEEETPAE